MDYGDSWCGFIYKYVSRHDKLATEAEVAHGRPPPYEFLKLPANTGGSESISAQTFPPYKRRRRYWRQ